MNFNAGKNNIRGSLHPIILAPLRDWSAGAIADYLRYRHKKHCCESGTLPWRHLQNVQISLKNAEKVSGPNSGHVRRLPHHCYAPPRRRSQRACKAKKFQSNAARPKKSPRSPQVIVNTMNGISITTSIIVRLYAWSEFIDFSSW